MSATEADREKARRALSYNGCDEDIEAIAEALAAEREKARAPFLALAEEMRRSAQAARDDGDPYWVPLSSIEHYADRIAEQQQ